MDPDAAWRELPARPSDATPEQGYAALNLLVWLATGGFTPRTDGSRADVARRCELVIVANLERLEDG